MSQFSLVDDPWIPCRLKNGINQSFSLIDIFSKAEEIQGLNVAPHEKVSLIRLFVAITQAHLGAPEDDRDWDNFAPTLCTDIPAYLSQEPIRQAFQLFGDSKRFLQVQVPAREEPVPASKLFPHLATGNNPTVYDQRAGGKRDFSAAQLALGLLTFQNFYPLYGAGYKGKGPCVDSNMVHAILEGDDLRKTILLNSLDRDTIDTFYPVEGFGKAIWELTDLSDPQQISIATQSYLGRLVPRHRSLWLKDTAQDFDLSNASLQYPNFEEAREPSATVVVKKKGANEERRLLGLRLERSLWRDLPALTVMRQSQGQVQQAPLVVQSHHEQYKNREVKLWVGGLITDLKAKILNTTESSFTVPYAHFTKEGRNIYEQDLELADKQSRQLFGAVKTYGSAFKLEDAPTEIASRHFWNRLDQQSSVILEHVNQASNPAEESPQADPKRWETAVRDAAKFAYESVCQRLTARQHKAFIEGLKILFPRAKKKA